MSDEGQLEPVSDKDIQFECHPGLECFTACCRKLNLMLTPYDIVRLARRLGISTTELVDRHTFVVEEPSKLPRLRLKMNDDDRCCPFLADEGCTVYEDRPGPCRAYPLARAASPAVVGPNVKEAFFVVREAHCKGHGRGPRWTPASWSADQGLPEYNALNDEWLKVLARQADIVQSPDADTKIRMFNLASYDLDQFRSFVFESGLTDRIALDERMLEKMRDDDVELMRFAFRWLRFAFFGEMCLNPRRA